MTAMERIDQARESVEEAELLARERMGTKAVIAKLYHAMMNCLFALFGIRDIGRLTHADVIERFEREYVNTGKLGPGVLAVILQAYDLTHECDCDHMPVPTEEEITAAMKAARELIAAADGFLKTEVKKHENSVV
jgi:uncharacterized protein (UPF0332 family)